MISWRCLVATLALCIHAIAIGAKALFEALLAVKVRDVV